MDTMRINLTHFTLSNGDDYFFSLVDVESIRIRLPKTVNHNVRKWPWSPIEEKVYQVLGMLTIQFKSGSTMSMEFREDLLDIVLKMISNFDEIKGL